MSIKITIPNSSSDVLTFGSGNTPTAAQIAGIDSGSSNGQLALYTTASGTSTERVRVDASGNVGIGTSSPTVKLDVRGNVLKIYDSGSATANLTVRNSTTGDAAGFTLQQDGVNTLFYNNSNGASVFATNGTERMRIDSSGRLMIGTTGSGGWSSNQKLAVQGSDTWISAAYQTGSSGGAFLGRVDNTAAELAAWYYGGSTKVGSITTNGTTTTYGTLSDHRLKENIAPMTGALEKVALLKPCTYKWKSNGSDGQGFIAHELQAVVPDCVVGEKDAVDADGNPQYQGIDTSFLVATLTAAIQELNARLTALENK
jgi:hypothetical protein